MLEMLQLQQGGKGASPGPNLPSETILALLAREVMTQVNKLQLAPGRPQAAQARQHQGNRGSAHTHSFTSEIDDRQVPLSSNVGRGAREKKEKK